MKRLFWGTITLIFATVLVGCDRLTQYTISEQDVNKYLQQHNNYQKQIGIPGLMDADITLSQLQNKIGRVEPGKITLTGNAKLAINTLLGSQNADLALTINAQPIFNREKGAIFLKEMALADYSVKPEKLESTLKILLPYLNQSLQSYFDQQPIYILNAENSKIEALAKKFAKGLEVKPGQLVIPFID